jgi:hypothetical protein
MPRLAVLPLLVACALVAGCGSRVPGDEEQIRTVLATFSRGVETRDYDKVCSVLSEKLLSGLQGIGLPCQAAMRKSLGEVREPRLTVGRVEIDGDSASAEVRTSAEGQEPSSDTMRLARAKDGWKIAALGRGEAPPEPSKP